MEKIFYLISFVLISAVSLGQNTPYSVVADDSMLQGYYFLRVNNSPSILDGRGNTIYSFNTTDDNAVNGYFGLLPDGNMTYGGASNYIITDRTFKIIDSVACEGVPNDPHEFKVLPNGNFLLLGIDTVRMDVSNYCFFKGKCGSKNALVRWAVIEEQDAKKKVVWEWHARDHFSVDDIDTFYTSGPEYLDVNHANALAWDADGNILMSGRNMNEITKINHKDGSVIWRLGGKRNQFTFLNCPVPFYAQHDVRKIANGNITLLDNGENSVPHGARALEFKLDEKNKIATLVWSFGLDTVMSGGWGNVQRLDHFKTLIDFGKIGDSAICFVVVDSLKNKIFQINGNATYRVLYYPSLPWKIQRPQITCFDSLGTYYLDAGPGYASYLWNTGASTRFILVLSAGEYFVFVPYGQRGFVSSEKITVTDIYSPCLSISSGDSVKHKPQKKRRKEHLIIQMPK